MPGVGLGLGISNPPIGGGSSAYTPAGDSAVVCWLKADSLSLSDGQSVSSWTDSSGNGNTATQGTGADQPVFKAGIINSLPVVRFNGSSDFMTITRNAGLEPNNVTVFAVVRAAATPAAFSYVAAKPNGANNSYALQASNGASPSTNGSRGVCDTATTGAVVTLIFQNGDVWNGSAHILALKCDGSNASFYGDGTTFTAGSATATGNLVYDSHNLFLGSFDGTQLYAAVDLAELIIYNVALTDAKRWQVQGYLGNKWAVP